MFVKIFISSGQVVTNGGRVLVATTAGEALEGPSRETALLSVDGNAAPEWCLTVDEWIKEGRG